MSTIITHTQLYLNYCYPQLSKHPKLDLVLIAIPFASLQMRVEVCRSITLYRVLQVVHLQMQNSIVVTLGRTMLITTHFIAYLISI